MALPKIVVLASCSFFFITSAQAGVAELYSNISNSLGEIRKKAPACSSTIRTVQDSVDALYGVVQDKEKDSKKEVETLKLESEVLQKELLSAKQESEGLKTEIQNAKLELQGATKDLEKERLQVALLKEQLAQMRTSQPPADADKKPSTAKKQADAQDIAQNLNRTSTSDPSSPR